MYKKIDCPKCNDKMVAIGMYIDLSKENEKYILYKCNDCGYETFKKGSENE